VTNQAISSLGFLSGMKLCYDQPYGSAHTTADLQACARQGSQVFVAGTYGSTVIVGAGGETSCVFQATSEKYGAYSTAHACNGAFWYNRAGYSFGFAGSSTVYLYSADVANAWSGSYQTGAADGATRLSWHDNGGGWRAGSLYGLGGHTYRKRIWVSSITTASPSYAGKPASIGPSFAAAAAAVMSA
jgi:hypothetical protein